MEESSCQNTPEDPKEEVKKLQELVRKLEIQNQQLRNRQNVSSKDEIESQKLCKNEINPSPIIHGPRTPLRTLDSHLNPNGVNIESDDSRSNDSRFLGAEKRELRKSGLLDDVDLINIEDLDISDEDSWLYTSPKGLSSEERSVSPHKWLRKDVEDLQNKELQLAKRALAYKLDESAILSSRRASDSSTFKKSPRGKPPIGRVVDSRTFTRGKKKRTAFEDGCDTLPVIEAFGDDEEEEDERERDSYSLTPHRSTDVIDVQEIARMQEESLRQSSPSTPKRISISSISGRRWSNSSKNSMSDNEEAPGSQQPTDGSSRQVPPGQDQSDACYTNSAHSSPPESLHGSNSSLDNGTEAFRHSLPNLSKGYSGARTFQRQQLGCLQVEMNGSPARVLGSGGKLSSIARSSAIQGERRLGLASRSASNLRSPSTSHRMQQQQQRQVVNGSPSPPCMTPPALSPTSGRHPGSFPTPKISGLPRLSRIPAPRSRPTVAGQRFGFPCSASLH